MSLTIINEQIENVTGVLLSEQVNSYLTYEGRAFDSGALTANPVWQLRRIIRQGSLTKTEYANSGRFDQIWNNRATIFAAGAFFNQISIFFDGVNDHISFGNNFNFETSIAFSVSVWIKPQNFSAIRYIFSKMENIVGVPGFRISVNTAGKVQSQVRTVATAGGAQEFNTTLVADEWTHIVWCWSGSGNQSGQKLYVNGALDSFTPGSITLVGSWINANNFFLGQAIGSGYFVGKMDEFAVYDKYLTNAEVTEIFNGGSPNDLENLTSMNNLLSWYRLGDNDTYPTVLDQVGTINGTMTGMTASNFVAEVP